MRLHTLPVLAVLGHLSQGERQEMSARDTDMQKTFPADISAGSSLLALPLGELSPKVTERVLRHDCLPSPSSLRSATSPKGRGKG